MQSKQSLLYGGITIFYVGLALLWQILAPHFHQWAIVFPTPLNIIQSMIKHSSLLLAGTWQTVWQAVVGIVIGSFLAVAIALLLHPLPWLAHFFYPLMYAWQAAPTIATTTLVLLWLGFGTLSKITLIVIVVFFPVYVSFSHALRSVDRQWLALLRSYGANRWQLFTMVRWPWSLVGFFSGVRVASTYLISVVVTAQWLGGQDGLGNILLYSRKSYDYALMMATVTICVLLSLIFIFLSTLVERVFLQRYHLSAN